MSSALLGIIYKIPAILIAFTAQGYARAKMADKLGDKTPRFQGRLTMNPIDHIDPMGFLMIIICGFGWTKPVETNPNAYKRGQKDSIKVTLAAPLANLFVGFIVAFVVVLFESLWKGIPQGMYVVGYNMLYLILAINVSLFIFNLLPLPGLAGFEIFKYFWPKQFYKCADAIYQYQMFILIGVILIGGTILMIPTSIIINLFETIARLVLGIFI